MIGVSGAPGWSPNKRMDRNSESARVGLAAHLSPLVDPDRYTTLRTWRLTHGCARTKPLYIP